MVAQLNHTIVAARDFGITFWPNPWRGNEGQINHNDGGRGLYFEDPSGHYLEVLTRPHGSGE